MHLCTGKECVCERERERWGEISIFSLKYNLIFSFITALVRKETDRVVIDNLNAYMVLLVLFIATF